MNIRPIIFLNFLFFSVQVPAGDDVAPGSLYAGSLVNVHSPNSEGWTMVESSSNGISFARPGKEKHSSYGAQVMIFGLPPSSNKDEFVALIAQGVKQDTPTERFSLIEESFEYTDVRGYPCVGVTMIVEDKKAKVSMFKKTKLILQSYSLYCRHPNNEELGFAAMYSYRGPVAISSSQADAEDFIRGVEVPDQ